MGISARAISLSERLKVPETFLLRADTVIE